MSAVLLFLASLWVGAETRAPITADQLQQAIVERTNRVAEFKSIAEWADKKGLRVWVAGGTAAGLAHFIKHDLEREWLDQNHLEQKYFAARFTYDYYDIYRSTQDADIVIDGTEEDAKALEHFLAENFRYLQGSKTIWEVRLLNRSRGSGEGEKDPLLSPDFQNQNTDSHSTGMIELSQPKSDEPKVRDLKDWYNHSHAQFIKDVVDGELHFYKSKFHSKTKRFKAGINPEILSVIRYFTKAFQYGLKIRDEDRAVIQKIIDDFNPLAEVKEYVWKQISKNSVKLFWNSQNVENSWNVLEEFGLRKKLVEFGVKYASTDVKVLMEREPLRTHAVGQGTGKTAAELEITMVAHETNSYLAYENITRSMRGSPNVFISRNNRPGEAAVHGDGFYTQKGKYGARGTGLTIRYQVDPNAREGTDFITAGTYVIFRNKAALTTIDESVDISWLQYFGLLADDSIMASNRGVLEKMKLKLRGKTMQSIAIPDSDVELIAQLVAQDIKKRRRNDGITAIMLEWMNLPISQDPKYLPLVKKIARIDREAVLSFDGFFLIDGWEDIFSTYLKKANRLEFDIMKRLFASPQFYQSTKFEKWVEGIIKRNEIYVLVAFGFTNPNINKSAQFLKWMDQILAESNNAGPLIRYCFSNPEMKKFAQYSTWLEKAMEHYPYNQHETDARDKYLYFDPVLRTYPKWKEWTDHEFKTYLDWKAENHLLALVKNPEFFKDPRYSSWITQMLRANPNGVGSRILVLKEVQERPELDTWLDILMEEFVKNRGGDQWRFTHTTRDLMSLDAIINRPKYFEWAKFIMENEPNDFANYLMDKVLKKFPEVADEWVEKLFNRMMAEHQQSEGRFRLLQHPAVYQHPKYIEFLRTVFVNQNIKVKSITKDQLKILNEALELMRKNSKHYKTLSILCHGLPVSIENLDHIFNRASEKEQARCAKILTGKSRNGRGMKGLEY